MAAHGLERARAVAANDDLSRIVAPKTLVRHILRDEPETHRALFGGLLDSGLSSDEIYRNLLSPTAVLMGDLWSRDELTFTDATIGLGRLRALIRAMDWITPYNGDDQIKPRSAIFGTGSGEEFTFGFHLIEEGFRWSGWRTASGVRSSTDQVIESVRRNCFDMVCLSLSRAEEMARAALAIQAIRKSSRNAEIFILVVGQAFVDHPEMVEPLGAHAAASSSRAALHIADKAVRPPTKQ